MTMHTITHQLAASTWNEVSPDIVIKNSESLWRVIQSEPDCRFMVCWISGQPDIAYVLDQDGFPLFADGVFDAAAGIAKLWEAEQTFHA